MLATTTKLLLAGSLWIDIAQSAQPSAKAPIPGPMRDLPWGDLNFLATTDTHGWHAGHLQEPQYSADWGDYISFTTRMKELADERGVDILVVDTGDRVDGNGLYDGSDPKGQYTYDIFKNQQIDIITSGNHELYEAPTADRELAQMVPGFGGNYLTSNLDIINPTTGDRQALGKRYRKFTTKNRGYKVLAFGFLFDFTGNANNTFVQPVTDTIKEDWFQEAIREKVDIFVITGHVALRSAEYKAIYTAIRKQNWDTPIQFFGGHSHIRDWMKYDSHSYALESGRYLETVGWMSISGLNARNEVSQEPEAKASLKFKRRYIDNNLLGYYHHTGLNQSTFHTELGLNVSATIKDARDVLDLDHTYGCAPKNLWLNRAPYPSKDSLLTWLETEVMPSEITRDDRADVPRLAIINSGALRFDMFKGKYTRDTTYILCPFQNKFRYIKDVPYAIAKGVLPLLNSGGPVFEAAGLQSWTLTPPEQISISENVIFAPAHYQDEPQQALGLNHGGLLKIPGYTTKDDDGTDGDDTEHVPINFYTVPNCVASSIAFPAQGEPDTVDLVFADFVQPWILAALKVRGASYTILDTEEYMDIVATKVFENYVKKHWACPADEL